MRGVCELDKLWVIDFTVSGELWKRDGGDWKGNIGDVDVVSLFYSVTEYIETYWHSRFDLYVTTPFLGRPPIQCFPTLRALGKASTAYKML